MPHIRKVKREPGHHDEESVDITERDKKDCRKLPVPENLPDTRHRPGLCLRVLPLLRVRPGLDEHINQNADDKGGDRVRHEGHAPAEIKTKRDVAGTNEPERNPDRLAVIDNRIAERPVFRRRGVA